MKTLKLAASIGDKAKTYSYSYEYNTEVPDGLTTIHEGLMQKGFIEVLRDASSTCKAKDLRGNDVTPTPAQRNNATLERLAKIKDGSYVFGGGGTRGPALSIEVTAWLAYFKSKGCTVKLVDLDKSKRLVPSSENLDQFQTAYVREAIWPSVSKVLATMDRATQDAFRKDKLPGIIEQHKERVIALAETDPKAVKPFIDAETLKRSGKPQEDDAFRVEIEISL